MFRILVLQALHGLSDAQAEHRVRDRLSFMRLLGLGPGERIPDERTIRLSCERLVRAGAMDRLFDRFEVELENRGHLAMSGRILDASLVAAPGQRNGDAGKAAIKDGRIPEDWPEVWREDWTTGPARLRQKDRDACWRMKQGKKKAGAKVQLAIAHHGYRSHIATDSRHGLIRTREVSSAAAPDGKHLKGLLSRENAASSVWADEACRSRANEAWMARNGFTSQIHHRKPPRKDLPAPLARAARPLARANARRSRVRSAVEHVLADRKQRMALLVRTIGLRRARIRIGMVNLACNMRRFVWLRARAAPA